MWGVGGGRCALQSTPPCPHPPIYNLPPPPPHPASPISDHHTHWPSSCPVQSAVTISSHVGNRPIPPSHNIPLLSPAPPARGRQGHRFQSACAVTIGRCPQWRRPVGAAMHTAVRPGRVPPSHPPSPLLPWPLTCSHVTPPPPVVTHGRLRLHTLFRFRRRVIEPASNAPFSILLDFLRAFTFFHHGNQRITAARVFV